MPRFITIEPKDVGKALFDGWGRNWSVVEFIGTIMWSDVGKRVYRVPDNSGAFFLQVENNEQYYSRLAKERPGLATFLIKIEQDMSDSIGRVTMPSYVLVDATSEAEAFRKMRRMVDEREMTPISIAVVNYLTLQETKQEYIYSKGRSGLREVF